MGAIAIAGMATLFVPAGRRDALIDLARGASVGALATILVSVNCTGMRLELVFVPSVAVGMALLGERLLARRSAAATV
jgi:hypothetical protein